MGEQDQRMEQRIKTLEYEFKILKNEIQRALLDIQEQILVHYYPSLRSEGADPADSAAQALESVKEKRGAVREAAAPGPAAGTRSDDLRVPVAAPAMALNEPPPQVKKVSLDDMRKTHTLATPVESAPTPARGLDQSTMIALSEWVTATSERIGAERARKLMEMFSDKGFMLQSTKEVLVRFSLVSGGQTAPERVATNDTINATLKLDALLGRPVDAEEALNLIEEAKLG